MFRIIDKAGKMKDNLLEYIESHYKTPVDYVLSKFETHDIVILGEIHRVKQQLNLYHQLIPLLIENGVNIIATEFARREMQPELDKLVTSKEYDLDLAKYITIKQEAYWGFQEYLDIYYLVWKYNLNKPRIEQIRMIGLNDPIKWNVYNNICRKYNRKPNNEELKYIWKDCGEKYWLDAINNNCSIGKDKVLAIMGSHHAFTKYKLPLFEVQQGKIIHKGFSKNCFGNYLFEEYGNRVFNICFHDPWQHKFDSNKSVQPVEGINEEVISPKYQSIGFDLKDSPFGELPSNDCIYSIGLPEYTISNMFDGYIYTGPLKDLAPVTPVEDFYTEENFFLFEKYTPFNEDYGKTYKEVNQSIIDDAKNILNYIQDFM